MPETPSTARVIAVVGPTAVGKTSLADRLALHLGGEVVTADSMQVYRGMDIGTAKPGPEERTVAHHCMDLVDPGEPFSAAVFQDVARAIIDRLLAQGRTPVIAGGTGLYVRAALDEMVFPPGDASTPVRLRLEDLAAELGGAALHDLLAEKDPASAALIHPNNVRRTIRALEMAEEGASYADQASTFRERRSAYPTAYLGLTMRRDALYERINQRVDAMIAGGLIEEIRGLLDAGYREALTASQAIGYKEFVPVLDGGADLADAIASVRQATRRYAKRQLTWFRADDRVMWIDVTDMSPEAVLGRAYELLESGERSPYPHDADLET